MATGTITVTNSSPDVTGEGTQFSEELKAGDYIGFTTGGLSYTYAVNAIASETQLTLAQDYDGPTVSGLAFTVFPLSQLISVPTQLINQTTNALRQDQADRDNWNKLLTVDGDVTITNPDGSQYTGPSWLKVAQGINLTDLDTVSVIADQIQTNADKAATSETNAKASEDAAAQSVTDASDSADSAATSAQQAADSVNSIGDDVTQSAANAQAASDSADRAEEAAKSLEDNNALFDAIDHIDSDTNDIYFKGNISIGFESNDLVEGEGHTSFNSIYSEPAAQAPTQQVKGGDFTSTYQIDQENIADAVFHASYSGNDGATAEITVNDYSGTDTETKTWTMPNDSGQLIRLEDTGIVSVSAGEPTFQAGIILGREAARDNEAVTLRQLNSATAGGSSGGATLTGVMNDFVGAIEWFNGTAAAVPAGYLPAGGQVLNRADYPDLWAAVEAGLFISVDETTWVNNDYRHRAKYSTGPTDTQFRLPDLNGNQLNSLQGLFLSGSDDGGTGKPARDVGMIYTQSAPNITGANPKSGDDYAWRGNTGILQGDADGAIFIDSIGKYAQGTGALDATWFNWGFDASRSDSTYGAQGGWLIPNSATGIWLIRVSGAFKAAETSFSVITSDESLPDSGALVYGGEVLSSYDVNSALYMSARMRASYTVGADKVVDIAVIDNSSGSPVESLPLKVHSQGHVIIQDGTFYCYATANAPSSPIGMLGYDGTGNQVKVGNGLAQSQFLSSQTFLFSGQSIASTEKPINTPAFISDISNSFSEGSNTRNIFSTCYLNSTQYVVQDTYTDPADVYHRIITLNGVGQGIFWFGADGRGQAQNAWVVNSDERLKEDIQRINNPLDKMKLIKGATWTRRDGGLKGMGFIAQDVQQVFPFAVIETNEERVMDDETTVKNVLSLDLSAVSSALHHEAILALMEKIDDLSARLEKLESRSEA